jgi:hypothetical protein
MPPPALTEFRASQTGEVQPGEEAPGFTLPWIPLQFGPVKLQPSVAFSVSYNHGLLAGPGQPENTLWETFSPSFLFVIGSHWTLAYSPTWTWYSSTQFQQELNHNFSLNWWAEYEDWMFSLAQAFSLSASPRVETGQQTEQKTFGTALSASYRFSSQMSLDLSLSQNIQDTQQFQSQNQWSTMEWLNYQFWPRLTAGLGVGGGYVDVSAGSDMAFEQFQGRISWRPGERANLTLHGGAEYRQFLTGGAPPLLSPVFGLAIQYLAGHKTSFTLSVDHNITASYLESQVPEATTLAFSTGRALSSKFTLSLSTSFTAVTYNSTAPGTPSAGSYDYVYAGANLSYAIVKHGSIAVAYAFSQNASSQTQAGLGFTSHQFTLSLGYSF